MRLRPKRSQAYPDMRNFLLFVFLARRNSEYLACVINIVLLSYRSWYLTNF
jgi:hypothetical protein